LTQRHLIGPVAIGLALLVATAAGADGGGRVVGTVRASPLVISMRVQATEVRAGKLFAAAALATNIATTPLAEVALTLRADASIRIVRATPTALGTLNGHSSRGAAWALCATSPGNYVIFSRVTAAPDWVAESEARLVTVSGSRRNCP
jgi:hypothetical protein